MNQLNFNKLNKLFIFISLIFLSYLFSNVAVLGVSPTIYVLLLITILLLFLRSGIGFLIFIYIVLYPLGDILPNEAILLPGINITEIISLMLILKYFMSFSIKSFNFTQTQKLAMALSFFFLVIYFPTYLIKHYFIYGTDWIPVLKIITRVLKVVIQFICIFIIIDCFNKSSIIQTWIKKGIIFGFIFLGLNIFLTPIFLELGMSIGSPEDYIKGEILESRSVGLFQGNANYLAHYMLVGIGFFLSVIEKKRSKIIFFGLIVVFSAILLSASRAGFICAVFLLLLFSIRNVFFKRRLLMPISIMILMIVIFQFFGGYLSERLSLFQNDLEMNIENYNRYKYQMYYFDEMMQNKALLLSGHWDKSTLFTQQLAGWKQWRIPHNQYFGMVFWGGLPYLFAFLIILFKIFNCNRKIVNSQRGVSIIYSLFAFSFMYLFNPNQFINYFPIFMILSAQYFEIPNKIRSNNSGLPIINS